MAITREEDQQAAMAAALPILPELHAILSDSIEFYFSEGYSAQARAEHDNRAMKSCIYSHADNRAEERDGCVPGFHCLNIRGLKVINYRDKALFRLKSVDATGNHQNYPTAQQVDYDNQQPLAGLPDPAARLTAGYELDEAGAGLKRVLIARRIGKEVVWTAQINVEDSVAEWQDITPQRFLDNDFIDIDRIRERGRRGR